jgi:hypothetical protein
MPQTRRAKKAAKKAGSSPLDRLQSSIDAAETALKDLRREVGRDSRDRLNDVGTTLTATRRNLTRSRRRITKDLEHALMKGKAKGKAKAKPKAKPKARVRSASTRTRKASRTSATRRTAASKSSAKPRSKGPAKPRSKSSPKRTAKAPQAS